MSIKINNLEQLLVEKDRLKKLCTEKELVIGKKLDYIQDNLGIIAFETILPVNTAEKSAISNILEGLHGVIKIFAPGISEKFARAGQWVKIIELVAASIITRFFNHKSE